MYDILIKNGTIIDGSGGEPFVGFVGISGDTIKEIGKDPDGSRVGAGGSPRGKLEIDASGKYITPGFIDITSHFDTTWSLFDYPGAESLLAQGVTTVIGGNCGTSLAPLASHFAIRSLQKWTDVTKINISWATMKEFLNEVSRKKIGVNFGTLAGYGTIRRGIVGEDIRELTPEETKKVAFLVNEAMEDGAFGVSTGRTNAHENIASEQELIAMAREIAGFKGVYKTHLKSESFDILPAINEAVNIGKETKVSVAISHLKTIGRRSWHYTTNALEMIDRARENGVDIHFDVFPYARTGSHLYQLLPRWAREGGFLKIFERIKDPVQKETLIRDLRTGTLKAEKIIIASADNPHVVGHTLKEISEETGLKVEEVILSLLLSNSGRVTIFGKTLSPRRVKELIAHPLSIIASDGSSYTTDVQKTGNLIHPRSFGAFVHFLHKYVRDMKLISWQEAVKKITSAPAGKIGIKDRGLLKERYKADVVVFDPITLHDRSNYFDPHHYATGVEWVMVNGIAAVEKGTIKNTGAGRVLRRI
ncbi:MAG: amidohydrolase family protein [bacterium]|nr:amidohydrolase family protein [bacterium]